MERSQKCLDAGSVPAPSTAVIEAIAEDHGCEPTDLEQPRHNVIDPDALDALCASADDRNGTPDDLVAFSYVGCQVRVFRDGSVDLTPIATG